MKLEKFFNTAGPVNFDRHYKIDPLTRWNLNEIMDLINQQKYFLLHAPRQSGKTSCMLALRDKINSENDFFCLYVNIEAARGAVNNMEEAMRSILSIFKTEIKVQTDIDRIVIKEIVKEITSEGNFGNALNEFLNELSELITKPVVLLIDEIDSVHGTILISILSQLRAGYNNRGKSFPWSIMLTGVADIKDYKIYNIDKKHITGGSCFNIKSKSLTLGNFSKEEIKQLYLEHTKETGQVFENEVYDLAWDYTAGQPWLVNALAFQVCFEMRENRDRQVTITSEMIRKAKEDLILSRQTHLDQLADKLKEDRVRRVIEPMILGTNPDITEADRTYCTDLGLIKKTDQGFVISNAIYREVLPRELTNTMQSRFLIRYKTPEWVGEDESINNEKLLEMFVQFWRENSDAWKESLSGYVEAAPHLIFQGFLQRVANGHGEIDREYALGNGRVDLYLKWNPPADSKSYGKEQRIIFELKIRTEKESLETIKKMAVKQTLEYADRCNATVSNILIFDRRENVKWEDKVFTETISGVKIWGM